MNTELIKMAFDAIRANKLRSALSILGVFIGVISIIIIMTLMDGFKYYVHNTFSSFSGNALYISKMPLVITSFEDFLKFQKRKEMKLRDFETIKKESSFASYVAPIFGVQRNVKYGKESLRTRVIASNQDEPFIDNLDLDKGRFYSASEVRSHTRVCVIGWDIAEQFYGDGELAIGKTLKIDGYSYRVIGIYKRKGAFFGQSMDQTVYIPITTLRANSRFFSRGLQIAVATEDPNYIKFLKDELTGIMRKIRKVEPAEKNDFSIYQINDLGKIFDQATQGAYLAIFFISLISLVVGGVGIMNIMVVAVVERTKEIGIRKSLGASRSNILKQFLSESVMITILGGIPAIIIGFGGAAAFLVSQNLTFPMTFQPIIVGVLFSIFVGVVSGFLPALRASRLKPVEALNK